MRFLLRTVLIVVGLRGLALFGQEPEPPLPKPDTQDSPSPGPIRSAASPSPSPEAQPDLIPPDIMSPAERAASPPPSIPSLPTLPQLDEAFKKKPISSTAGVAEKHAQWRALKNQVANREDVRAARRAADAASTDLEKRTLLRKYYEIFYGQMLALATNPELKAYVNDRKNDQLNTLPQPRVRPTPTPSPTPTPKPKR